MNILLITEYYYPIESGAEKVARLFYEDIIKHTDIKVDILSSRNVKNSQVKYPILFTFNGLFLIQELYRYLNYYVIKKVIRKGNYDIVTIHGFNSLMYYSVKASNLRGIPSVMVMCSSDILDVKKHETITFHFLKAAIKYTNIFVAKGMSPTIMRDVLNIPINKFRFIVNPAISNSPEDFDIKDKIVEDIKKSEGFKIVTSGKLSRTKNPKILIEAVYSLHDNNIKLYFFGEGPLKQALEKYVKSLQMQEQVFFLGVVNNPFLYYKYFDLYIFPTNLEPSLSQAMMEAMYCKLPVIVKESEGIKYWFRHLVNTFMVKDISVIELSNAIKQMIDKPNLRELIGVNARQVIIKQHSIASFTDSMMGIFNELGNSN